MNVTVKSAPSRVSADVWSEEDELEYQLTKVHTVIYTKECGDKITTEQVDVPIGFVTDLASVPKIPIIYGNFKECSAVAPVFHDYIYRTTSVNISKHEADLLFRDLLLYEGVDSDKADLMYEGVRLFGESSYKERV